MLKDKIKTRSKLKGIIRGLKKNGERIAFTNGCFDILHRGHVEYLEAAKRCADILIVALNSDKSIKRLKKAPRPIINEKGRAMTVAALESVDYVTIFEEVDPLKVIMELKPDILIKGGDWDVDKVVGKDFVESYGGIVKTIPYVQGYSTSAIIERIKLINSEYRNFKIL